MFKLIIILLIIAVSIFTTICNIIKYRKKSNPNTEDKTEGNGESKLSLLSVLKDLIIGAEEIFKNMNTLMKKDGVGAGSIKKKTVLSDLQAYAVKNGIEFNIEEWSTIIDDIIEFTKLVN